MKLKTIIVGIALLSFLWMFIPANAQNQSAEEFAAVKSKAEKRDPEAQRNLGYRYAEGQGVPKDYGEAAKWYRKSADQGYAIAQCDLGSLYMDGLGVKQDYAEAAKWYRKAADQGFAKAQSNLGSLYATGQGVPIDYGEAVKWCRKAADQGHAIAQYNLGSAYAHGQGVEQDYAEAVKWYRKAADQGYADAQNNLGSAYTKGQGVERNDTEAAKWYRKAADQGDAAAQCNLGLSYAQGLGVEQDYAEATRLFRGAADQGYADAQSNLGFAYYQGFGVTKNYAEAYFWYSLSAAGGNKNAAHDRDIVAKQISSAEVTEGQRRVAAFAAIVSREATVRPQQQVSPQAQQTERHDSETVATRAAYGETPPHGLVKMPADITCSVDQVGVQFGSGPLVRVSCWIVSKGSAAAKNLTLEDDVLKVKGAQYILNTKDFGTWYITGGTDTISIIMDVSKVEPLRHSLE
jgi:hypothetical protein